MTLFKVLKDLCEWRVATVLDVVETKPSWYRERDPVTGRFMAAAR